MPQKRMECFRLLLEHLAWIEHEFLSGIRDSRRTGSLWRMMRGVGGVRKSIHHSWLAKGLGLGLLCWVFKGVQVEITSEEASILQIRSVAFPSWCNGYRAGLRNHSTRVRTPIALLRSLSGKYSWEMYEPPCSPSHGLNRTTTVLLGE